MNKELFPNSLASHLAVNVPCDFSSYVFLCKDLYDKSLWLYLKVKFLSTSFYGYIHIWFNGEKNLKRVVLITISSKIDKQCVSCPI